MGMYVEGSGMILGMRLAIFSWESNYREAV